MAETNVSATTDPVDIALQTLLGRGRERKYITQLGPDEWVVDGLLSVHEANETLDWDLPLSDEYETVAGWLLVELGHIPAGGEEIVHRDLVVRVDAVRRRRIARIRVSRTSVPEES